MIRKRLKMLAAKIFKTKTVHYSGLVFEGAFEDFGFLQALHAGGREPYTVELFLGVLQPGMTVVDIGAHLGQFTLLAARRIGPSGRVWAFEPHPRTYSYLKRNIDRNALTDRITAFDQAVSDRSASAILQADLLQSDFTSLVHVRDASEAEAVMVITTSLDDIQPPIYPDVLKIDVEGAELRVLAGLRKTLERSRAAGKSPILFIESNADALRRAHAGAQQLRAALQDCGFVSIQAIFEAKKTLDAFEGRALEGCVNLICR